MTGKNRFVSIRITFAVMLAAISMTLGLGSARADIPRSLNVRTRDSGTTPANYLAANGTIWMQVSAVLREGDPENLLHDKPITFDDPNNTGKLVFNAGGSDIVNGPVVANTVNGQAVIRVKGNSTAAADVTLRARWLLDGVTKAETPITIRLRVGNLQLTTPTPEKGAADPDYLRPANRCDIRWKYDDWSEHGTGTTVFRTQIEAGMRNWETTGLVRFVPAGTAPSWHIAIQEVCLDTVVWYGRAEKVITMYGMQMNKYYLAGGRQDAGNPCPSDYPPRDDIFVQMVATHELGHTLNFTHNGVDNRSLMWGGITQYFVCGTTQITSDETNGLVAIYGNTPCP